MQRRTQSPARPKWQGVVLLVTLFALLMVLAACGGREPAPEAPATPTLIPTLAPLEPVAAAPAEEAATATPEAAAEATVAPSAEMTGTEDVAATEEVTAGEELTAAEDVAAAEEMTATEEVAAAETVTESEEITAEEITTEDEVAAGEEMTATEEVAATEDVTETEEVAAAEEVTASEGVTDSTGLGAAEEITETEEIVTADEMTSTEEPAETEAMTGTEETAESEEAAATEEITGTAEVTEGEAITESEEVAETEEVSDTEEVTSTEEVTGTEEVTETEGVAGTEEISAGEEMTETEAAAPSGAASLLPGTAGDTTGDTADSGERNVFFLQPTTNAIIPITSTVVIGYAGVEIQPSGEVVEGAGHLHILVDEEFVEAGSVLPTDDTHLHLGDGSTSKEVVLEPGSHILRLQFADGAHTALEGDQYRDEIYVNVIDDAPEEAVRFVVPTDGAVVPPTFTVVMAASGLSVEPSGAVNEDAGHLHILVDEDFVAEGDVIPTDDTHLHFGAAQLTGTVTLEPGEHTLRLQFADGEHHALDGDQYRAEITVTVDDEAEESSVRFTSPEDGATVTAPFTLSWAASGLILESAGEVVRPGGGHVFVLINNDFVPAGEVIRSNATNLRFGRGQTSAELDLRPGEYTLRLQVVDGASVALDGEEYQDEITLTVE